VATRQSEGHEIAGLCRRVGWDVRRVADGWRVVCGDGTPVVIHLTPSDRNNHKPTLRILNDHGLATALAELAEREEAQRQQRIAADREANTRRTEREAAKATALAKAAGPYGPARVTIDDILAEHPAPIIFGRVLVTPAMAEAILQRNQPNAQASWPMRPIRRGDLSMWANRLRAGRFRYTHQGVALDADGRLQDGQHRLTAIAETGIAGEMMVSAGWPGDNYTVHDTGRRRTAGQALQHQGAANANTTASAVRLIHLYEVWDAAMLDHAHERVDNDVVVDTWAKLDGERLGWAVATAQRLRREIGCGPTAAAAAFYVIGDRVRDIRVQRFTDGLVRGVQPLDGDPVYVLRRQLTRVASGISHKLTAAEQMALVIKGWNAYAQQRTTAHLTVRSGSPMPSVYQNIMLAGAPATDAGASVTS